MGDKVAGSNEGDRFGTSLASLASGLVLAVGAVPNKNRNDVEAGQVKVFD